jgi:hypothetical protein
LFGALLIPALAEISRETGSKNKNAGGKPPAFLFAVTEARAIGRGAP